MYTNLMPIFNQPSNNVPYANHTKLLNSIPIVSYRIHTRHYTWLCKVTHQPIIRKHRLIQPTLSISLKRRSSHSGRRIPCSSYQISSGRGCNSGHDEVSLKLTQLTQARLLSLRREAFAEASPRTREMGELLLFSLRQELFA